MGMLDDAFKKENDVSPAPTSSVQVFHPQPPSTHHGREETCNEPKPEALPEPINGSDARLTPRDPPPRPPHWPPQPPRRHTLHQGRPRLARLCHRSPHLAAPQ